MTCPTCKTDSGITDSVSSGGLVTREKCGDAWHLDPQCRSHFSGNDCHKPEGHAGDHYNVLTGVGWSAANTPPAHEPRPIDRFQGGDGDAAPEPAQLAGPTITCACGVKKTSYGHDGTTTLSACPFCGRPDPRTLPRPASWPFDPNPPKLIPAESGFVWCHACEKPQPTSGHECGAPLIPAAWLIEAEATLDRAEFAESLLCAMAFDHARKELHCVADYDPSCPPDEWWEDYCAMSFGDCAFCDAARGGSQ